MSPDPEAVEWFERTRGIKAAKEQGDVPYLIAQLTDTDHRGRAAKALGELGATEAIPRLMRLLDAADPGTRIDAVRALGRLQATEAIPRIRDLASADKDATARSWACQALVDLGDPHALELTLPLLADPLISVRGSAAYTLGRLGDARALAALRAARPRLHRSPIEWWAYRETYRRARSALTRRAAGKAPRTWTEAKWVRWARELVWVSALVAIFVALWAYVSFWWGVWVVAAIVVGWLFMMFLFFRKLPLD
jgi:HEAT repeat protein